MLERNTIALLTLALLLGCGSGRSSDRASTAGPSTTTPPTTTPPTTPVQGAHGTIVSVPTATGTTWAFLQDGAAEAWEIVDTTGLVAAGALIETTLTVDGDRESNVGGASSLGEALRVVAFQLDDVHATLRINGQALEAPDGTAYDALGTDAAALMANAPNTPLRVTGWVDAAHVSASGNLGLQVTSWRQTIEVQLRVAGGLTGMDERFTVEDLPGTGAARYTYDIVVFPTGERHGKGRVSESQRASIEAATSAANLRSQPTSFRPVGFIIFDAPTTYIHYADKDGEVNISIAAGSTLPAEVTALLDALRNAKTAVPTRRVLEGASRSMIQSEEIAVARTDAEWQALYARHAGPGATLPQVDFTTHFVVGAFMGSKPSGGYGIAVSDVEQRGDDLHVSIERTTPAPGQPVTLALTSPYQIAVVDRRTGSIFVDGVQK